MKKCLIKGALTLSLGIVFISCGDKDIEFQSIADAKVQSFDENFRATFGYMRTSGQPSVTLPQTTTGVSAVQRLLSHVQLILMEADGVLTGMYQLLLLLHKRIKFVGISSHIATHLTNPLTGQISLFSTFTKDIQIVMVQMQHA